MKQTQHDKILNLLKSGEWVSLPEILRLNISQYGRVINDLRNGKYKKIKYYIENKGEWVNGQHHTWFKLIGSSPVGNDSIVNFVKEPQQTLFPIKSRVTNEHLAS